MQNRAPSPVGVVMTDRPETRARHGDTRDYRKETSEFVAGPDCELVGGDHKGRYAFSLPPLSTGSLL